MKIHPVQLVGSTAIVLLGLGYMPGAPVPLNRAADAVAHLLVDPSVQAGIFTLDSRAWWGAASIDLSGSAPKASAP